MNATTNERLAELVALDAKIKALLPPQYLHCYSDISPNSMGSAEMKYQWDGKIAWDRIWTTFCDLALAGGPPHRGTLLEPVTEAEAVSDPDRYRAVIAEIIRAVSLTTGLTAHEGEPGWVEVQCASSRAAAWLHLAIVAENVSARHQNHVLYLPAGPQFRMEKEVKNVVVALAKSYHYWDGHLTSTQQQLSLDLDCDPARQVDATSPTYLAAVTETRRLLHLASGLRIMPDRYAGWVGIDCCGDAAAVWLMRAVLVEQILVRREGAVLYLPISLSSGLVERVTSVFAAAWRLYGAHLACSRTTE